MVVLKLARVSSFAAFASWSLLASVLHAASYYLHEAPTQASAHSLAHSPPTLKQPTRRPRGAKAFGSGRTPNKPLGSTTSKTPRRRRRAYSTMPQKRPKNNGSKSTDNGVFSYGERKNCSFMSSIDERTGADAQLPFGWCALSLQPAKDPVCTPLATSTPAKVWWNTWSPRATS